MVHQYIVSRFELYSSTSKNSSTVCVKFLYSACSVQLDYLVVQYCMLNNTQHGVLPIASYSRVQLYQVDW